MNRQEADSQLRELRRQSSRLRRQLERRADRLAEKSLMAIAPTRYIQEHPLKATLAAAGIGAAASTLAKPADLAELARHFPLARDLVREFTQLSSEKPHD